jgi:nucleoside-diphosphate-sugar epimerase
VVRRLSGVDVVVHAALDLHPDADPPARTRLHVEGTQTVVTAAAAAGVRRLVLVTSAMVYGTGPDAPVPLDEDGPLAAEPQGLPGDLLEMEEVAVAARRIHPGLDVVVVRPAALVGAGIDTLVTRHFAAPRLLAVRDGTMRWQFCHIDDLVAAVAAAVAGQATGSFTVAGDGWLTQADVERGSGLRRVELPATVVFGTADRLHRAGMVPTPASELAFVLYPWVVPSTRLRASGWVPQVDAPTAFGVLLEQVEGERALVGRRLGRKDATIAGAGAAGATVAVLGAAAFVRRARRLRGR